MDMPIEMVGVTLPVCVCVCGGGGGGGGGGGEWKEWSGLRSKVTLFC